MDVPAAIDDLQATGAKLLLVCDAPKCRTWSRFHGWSVGSATRKAKRAGWSTPSAYRPGPTLCSKHS